MQTITNCAPISRASIARQTGLSKQTVSEVVHDLTNTGWICETGVTSGHIGRSATVYELVANAAYIVSIDLGGTKVKVAIADMACNIIATFEEPTDSRGGMHVMHQIVGLCHKVVAANQIDIKKLRLAVLGVPGVPDPKTGHVLMAPNIGGIDEIDVSTMLTSELGFQTTVENDVNLAVFGEHYAGSAVGVDNLAFISLGTGIGSGIIIEGKLMRGVVGAAGELGYLPLGADPFEAESVRVGALERSVGTMGICAHYQKLVGQSKTVPEIFDAAQAGDSAAEETLHSTARVLAQAITALCAVINPELVVLGGSIGRRTELIQLVHAALVECYAYPIAICPSSLGADAGLVGGVAMGLRQLHKVLFAHELPTTNIILPKPQPVFPK